jgi:hypothetical protein
VGGIDMFQELPEGQARIQDDFGEGRRIGFDDCRSQVVNLLPQIIYEAQKAKVEEIRKIINIELNDKFYTYLGERLKKEGAIEEGFEIALLTILSNLK